MKTAIVVPAYNCGRDIIKLYKSAMLDAEQIDIKFYIFLHSRHVETKQACQELSDYNNVIYYAYGKNRGLALTWNDGSIEAYKRGHDVVIISNDDIVFSPGDVRKLTYKAVKCRANYMISAAGWHITVNEQRPSQGYSCFALNPIALETIGCFDENFFPAYLEDMDHHYRATAMGLVEENCPDTNVTHAGSMAIRRDARLRVSNTATQKENMQYFLRKWNVISHQGGYHWPFNDSRFDMKIRIEDRHLPYPGYNRRNSQGGAL